MIKCKLKNFQQTKKVACIETEDDLFFLYADKGKFNKDNLKKLVAGDTILIDGIDPENDCSIVGPGTITNMYNYKHKPLYTAKKTRLSLFYS